MLRSYIGGVGAGVVSGLIVYVFLGLLVPELALAAPTQLIGPVAAIGAGVTRYVAQCLAQTDGRSAEGR